MLLDAVDSDSSSGFQECHLHGHYSSCCSSATFTRIEALVSMTSCLLCIYIQL